MKIAFILPPIGISGGIYVVFEHATRIKRKYNVDVYIITEEVTSPKAYEWHSHAHELKFSTIKEIANDHFDLAIATFWRTVFYLPDINATRFAYFVQSIESKFYQEDGNFIPALVDSTYIFGIPVITEATWIRDYFINIYGNTNLYLVKNGIRKDLYTNSGDCISNRKPDILRVLVEGPINIPFKNVAKTLSLCKKSNADEIWLLTSTPNASPELADRVFSNVSINEVAKIYRSCDVLVKLSYVEGMFGPPLEIFHCGGTAIVYDVTGHDEYIVNGVNGIVINVDDEDGVINAINLLKKDRMKLESLKLNALETASRWHDWDSSADLFYKAICDIHNNEQDIKHNGSTKAISDIKRLVGCYDGILGGNRENLLAILSFENTSKILLKTLINKIKFRIQWFFVNISIRIKKACLKLFK